MAILFAVIAVFMSVGCGGGGVGGVGTPVHAAPADLLNAGVNKDIWVGVNGTPTYWRLFNNVTSAVTITGNQVTFVDNAGGSWVTTAPVVIGGHP